MLIQSSGEQANRSDRSRNMLEKFSYPFAKIFRGLRGSDREVRESLQILSVQDPLKKEKEKETFGRVRSPLTSRLEFAEPERGKAEKSGPAFMGGSAAELGCVPRTKPRVIGGTARAGGKAANRSDYFPVTDKKSAASLVSAGGSGHSSSGSGQLGHATSKTALKALGLGPKKPSLENFALAPPEKKFEKTSERNSFKPQNRTERKTEKKVDLTSEKSKIEPALSLVFTQPKFVVPEPVRTPPPTRILLSKAPPAGKAPSFKQPLKSTSRDPLKFVSKELPFSKDHLESSPKEAESPSEEEGTGCNFDDFGPAETCVASEPHGSNLELLELALLSRPTQNRFLTRLNMNLYSKAFVRLSAKLQKTGLEELSFEWLYTLHEQIAEGAFSRVFLATQVLSGEKVAVKVVSKSRLSEGELLHLRNEVEILRKLPASERIARFLESFEDEGQAFLVFEFVSRGNLLKHLSDFNIPGGDDLVDFFWGLVEAVSTLHTSGIVHRDMKLENILVDRFCRPKVTDFGLSLFENQIESANFDSAGSLAYLAPEILSGGKPSPKSDIWALAVLLYVLLYGESPFEAETEEELRREISSANWRRNPKQVDPCWLELLTGMFRIDPSERLSIVEVKQNPIFARRKQFDCFAVETSKESEIDKRSAIAQFLAKQGISCEKLLQTISAGEKNHLHAFYWTVLGSFSA